MLVGYYAGYSDGAFDSEVRYLDRPSVKQAKERNKPLTTDSFTTALAKSKANLTITKEELAEGDALIASVNKASNVGAGLTFATIADKITAAYRDHASLAGRLVKDFVLCAATVGDDCSRTAQRLEENPAIR
jgi:hypothetical protein